MKSTLQGGAAIIGVALLLLLPGWLEVRSATKAAAEFANNARRNDIEARIVRSLKEIENPFTWWNGKPRLVAARKPVDDNFLVLYARYSDEATIMDKALVSADCKEGRMRLVSRSIYEDFQSESGYDVLGNKLPDWEDATYYDMLAVLISQEPEAPNQSAFYDIACNWNNFRRIN